LIEKDADIKEIAAMVENDPVITARVLHIANSSFFGTKTGSINQAIVFLGLTAIKNIVLTTSIFESGNNKMTTSFNSELLWKHASLTNKLTIVIYEKLLGKKIPDVASTAGLLHDIGRVILLKQFSREYTMIIEELQNRPDASFCEVEKQVLGISHQDVGGYLLDWWGLPQPIVEAALFHHEPLGENVVDRELVSVVHLADYYACKILNYTIQRQPDEKIFQFLNITQEACEKIGQENKNI
jgi:HD-like signal output (HDOD) protein